MAARFAYFNPDMLKGLVFWASYPASDNDLSGRDLNVVTVRAQRAPSSPTLSHGKR